MSAGKIWKRHDGLRWVEVQAPAVEPSGWRFMVPLVDLDDAPDAPPLVITVGDERARVHLLSSAPHDELGDPDGELRPDQIDGLAAAARVLLDSS